MKVYFVGLVGDPNNDHATLSLVKTVMRLVRSGQIKADFSGEVDES